MSKENLCSIKKGGGQNMSLPRALRDIVTGKYQQHKQNNGITEKKTRALRLLNIA